MPAFQEAGILPIVTGQEWLPPALYGIAPMIVASLVSTAGAILIGVPIALLSAVFIAEIAPKWLSNIIRPAVELLAGIPSVVYGFFGLIIIVPLIEVTFDIPAGNTLFAGIIVLAVMILPTVITVSETSLPSCSHRLQRGSLCIRRL